MQFPIHTSNPQNKDLEELKINGETQKEYFQKLLQFSPIFYQKFEILYAKISNDYKFMATQDQQFRLILWDIPTNSIMKLCKTGKNYIKQMIFTNDSKHLIIRVYISDLAGEIQIFSVDTICTEPKAILHGHTLHVSCIAVTSDSKFLLSGGTDRQLKLWELTEFKSIFSLQLSDKIAEISISEKQDLFLSNCYNGLGYLFSCKNIKKSHQILKWQTYPILQGQCITFALNSSKIITNKNDLIQIWVVSAKRDMRLLRQITFNLIFPFPYHLQFLSGRFITKYQYNQFHFWDMQTGVEFTHANILDMIYTYTKNFDYIVALKKGGFVLYKRKEI